MSDYDDYENNLFFPPLGDMSKLNDCNDGKRGTDVLMLTLEKCQKIIAKNVELEKKLEIAKEALLDIENNRFSYIDEQNCVNTKHATQKELRIIAKDTLRKIKE